MLSRDEFVMTLAKTNAFVNEFLRTPSSKNAHEFYDIGLRIAQAAVHVKVSSDDPEFFDNRLLLLRLAEAMVEASFVGELASIGGTTFDDSHIQLLTTTKIKKAYEEKAFLGNEYDEHPRFGKLRVAMNFISEFFKTVPTVDFSKVPNEIVIEAITSDVLKTTAMTLWAIALSHDKGIGDHRRMMKLIYSIKYGIVMAQYDTKKVQSICDEILPWIETLAEVTVGHRPSTTATLN